MRVRWRRSDPAREWAPRWPDEGRGAGRVVAGAGAGVPGL